MEINHCAKGKGSQVSGFRSRWFAATITNVHKIIIPGYWLGNAN